MEFDWLDVNFDLKKVSPKDIEESFEDPFAIKMLPDPTETKKKPAISASAKPLAAPSSLAFLDRWEKIRVISARNASANETSFYERKCAESL